MRISNKEKKLVAKKIMAAAVTLIGKEGFEQVSMRQIAKAAGVGDATIYRYFPTKHALLYGYFDQIAESVITRLQKIPDYAEYSFIEQFQILIYTHLDLFEPDRAFVTETYQVILKGGFLKATAESAQLRERGLNIMNDLLTAAVESGEIPDPPMKPILSKMLLDLLVGATLYWTKDDSKDATRTLQLVDKMLVVVEGFFKSNILGGIVDVAQFLFREHLVAQFTESTNRNFDFSKIKQQFYNQSI